VVSLVAIVAFTIGLLLEINTRGQGQAYYATLSLSLPENPERHLSSLKEAPINEGSNVEGSDVEENVYVPFMDFTTLREMFPDIVAWIQLPGTIIDYPVVQGNDNDYFLSRLPDGTKHKMGSIFLDYQNTADFSDNSILIYGHDMKSGDMFGSLKNYTSQEFYENHPHLYIYTPEKDYDIKLLAGYIIDSSIETPPMGFQDKEAFEGYISDIKARSIFNSETTVSAEDKLVFLCTCTSGSRNDRLIVVGKMLENS